MELQGYNDILASASERCEFSQGWALRSVRNFILYNVGELGSAAYVGQDNAVFDVPKLGPFYGTSAGVVWKSFEAYSQFSLRNQLLVVTDFLRTKIFGRDISRNANAPTHTVGLDSGGNVWDSTAWTDTGRFRVVFSKI
eukprot:scaffold221741_cov19-Tisochrysis_lutea.AAC.1